MKQKLKDDLAFIILVGIPLIIEILIFWFLVSIGTKEI